MKLIALAVMLTVLGGVAGAQTYVQLILDASGSMYDSLDTGETRIEAAKQVLSDFVGGLPSGDLNVGLRIYGANTKALDAGACEDSDLVVPIQGVDKDALLGAVSATEPQGATPIALSLERAAADFPPGVEKIVILVTDGEESCGGDIQAVMHQLGNQGIEIDLRVIGIGLSTQAIESFTSVGETFTNAQSAAEFSSALDAAVAEVVPSPSAAAGPLALPAEVLGGTAFEVSFDGLDKDTGYLTLVPRNATEGSYNEYHYTANASPLVFTAPLTAGPYEVRYQADAEPGVFLRQPITVLPPEIGMTVPAEVEGGTAFDVAWDGPKVPGAYLTIVPRNASEGAYGEYFYTNQGPVLGFTAPLTTGPYEVRYQSEAEPGTIFARQGFNITAPIITIEVPDSVTPGSTFDVAWTGPDRPGAYLTIVAANAPAGSYGSYLYTNSGPVLGFTAPAEAGSYEVRYQSDNEPGIVFARVPLVVQ